MAERSAAEAGCSVVTGCSTQGEPARSLADRVEQLPKEVLDRFVRNVGSAGSGKEAEERKGWGFARIPWEYTEQQGKFHESLRLDRWFNCPDCMDGMSEAFGVTTQIECLRGSALSCLPSEEQISSLKSLNAALRKESKCVWSREAVLKGVQVAKMGDYRRARECYDQALELNARNVDALVARGAAFANQSRFQEAVNDFERALEIDPSHPNASDYLAATRQKLATDPPRRNGSQASRRETEEATKDGNKFDLASELQEAFAAVKRKHTRRDGSAAKERRSHKQKKKRRRDSSGQPRKSKKRKGRRSKSDAEKSKSRSPGLTSDSDLSSE